MDGFCTRRIGCDIQNFRATVRICMTAKCNGEGAPRTGWDHGIYLRFYADAPDDFPKRGIVPQPRKGAIDAQRHQRSLVVLDG